MAAANDIEDEWLTGNSLMIMLLEQMIPAARCSIYVSSVGSTALTSLFYFFKGIVPSDS